MSGFVRRELTLRHLAQFLVGGGLLYLAWSLYGWGAAGLAIAYGVFTELLGDDE